MEFDAAHFAAGGVKLEHAEATRFSLCRFVGFTKVLENSFTAWNLNFDLIIAMNSTDSGQLE